MTRDITGGDDQKSRGTAAPLKKGSTNALQLPMHTSESKSVGWFSCRVRQYRAELRLWVLTGSRSRGLDELGHGCAKSTRSQIGRRHKGRDNHNICGTWVSTGAVVSCENSPFPHLVNGKAPSAPAKALNQDAAGLRPKCRGPKGLE